jgi:ATP-dependent protease ClpP protease subunit
MKADAEEVEIVEILNQAQQSGMIRVNKQVITQYNVFLDRQIGAPSEYRDLINALYNAGEGDIFNIVINSPGGYLSSAMAIIEAINNTEALVRAIMVGECHSAASLIALKCHEIVLGQYSHMMCHTADYVSGGNTHNVQAHANFSTSYINRIIDDVYKDFLTETELSDLRKGAEVWLDYDELEKRMLKRQELLVKAAKEEAKIPNKGKKA